MITVIRLSVRGLDAVVHHVNTCSLKQGNSDE